MFHLFLEFQAIEDDDEIRLWIFALFLQNTIKEKSQINETSTNNLSVVASF